jgi:hypothetical protein
MGSSSQGSQWMSALRMSGRGFSVADPERQREVDLERVFKVRRDESSALRSRPPAIASFLAMQRDPADEGGSVRRGR